MTERDLETAIGQSAAAVVSLLLGRDEKTRRAVAPVALAWYKALNLDFAPQVNGVARATLWSTVPLAMLGCATLAELKKARLTIHFEIASAVAVLVDRRPDWLAEYAQWVLENSHGSWIFVRSVQRAGLMGPLDSEAYTLGMVACAGRHGAYHLLTEDSELLGFVDRLFEVEGSGELSLAAHDKYTSSDAQWATALRRLSQEGRLSREHLLSGSLRALSYGFATFRAGWFSRFYESLHPSPEEMARDTDTLLLLLGSPISTTASFALKTVSAMARTRPPDPEKLQAALTPVWTLPQKGPVLQGLKLLLSTPQGEPWLEHLSRAAEHPLPEVQREALKALKKVAPKPEGPWRARWLEMEPSLEPSVRADWCSWLSTTSTAKSSPAPTSPLSLPQTPAPVRPCQDLQDVLDLAAQLLEEAGPPTDIERLLDGMGRFEGRAHPQAPALLKRIKTRLKSPDLRARLGATVSTWLGHPLSTEVASQAGLEGFLFQRLDELGRSQPSSLHGLPESEDGQLSAATLARRLSGREKPRLYDFTQALLRLDPTESPPEEGAGEPFDAMRYALGGPAGPRRTSLWWEAADLVRGSLQEQPWTFEVKHSSHQVAGKTYHHRSLRIPQLAQRAGAALVWSDETSDVCSLRWQATVSPALRESFQLMGIEQIANNLDWWEADWSDRVYLEGLLQLAERWRRSGMFLAALGLGCKEPGQRGLAVDAVAQGLAVGLLEPGPFGQVMAEAASTGMITPKRWATSFDDLRSFADQEKLLETLQSLLANDAGDFDPRPLLGPLLEIAVAVGRPVEDEAARTHLRRLAEGGGKAAKQAARILKL